MSALTVTVVDDVVWVNESMLTPGEAVALASELITAANVANGVTPTGVFA